MSTSHIPTDFHYHVRSISLPSRLHPSLPRIEKELKRMKTWDDASKDATSSMQTEAIKAGLTGLTELYCYVQELIGSPHTQKALLHHEGKHVEKPLDMSVSLLDICGSTRELLLLMKEHVLHLQSAMRRKGLDSSVNDQICAYICFKKRAKKDISKRLKALKTIESSFKPYPLLDIDHHLVMMTNVLRELSKVTISFFRQLVHFICAPVVLKKHTRGWTLFSKIVSTRCDIEKRSIDYGVALCYFHKRFRKIDVKSDVQIVKRRLGEVEWSIGELEAGLDCLFRCLIQQRVSLLNLLTQY
ncbi:hypothetical protein RJT34_06092 [Clitoria ternatea]|uniref:Uncharacterized protein n=1 Tax=Clitoria ternatea TaxID=43366 RepID=A0AAN9K1D8_CLITE